MPPRADLRVRLGYVPVVNDDAVRAIARAARPDLVALYRFGSTAAGGETTESDCDLALLAASPLDPLERFELEQRLAVAVHRDVDLVDLLRASTVLRMQIIASGIVIDVLDERERARFEDRVFVDSARLNEERREILDRIHAEELIHAG